MPLNRIQQKAVDQYGLDPAELEAQMEREARTDYENFSRVGPPIGFMLTDREFTVGDDPLLRRLKAGVR